MPKYVSYDEMMEILDNKYLLPFRKDERLRGLNGIDIVRCKDCKHRYVDGENGRYNVCELNHNKVQSNDWFCADGERSEE